MIDEDTYCIDVLTQISAITSALNKVALGLVDDHLNHCVRRAINNGETYQAEAAPHVDSGNLSLPAASR